jgi:hypothetical protein
MHTGIYLSLHFALAAFSSSPPSTSLSIRRSRAFVCYLFAPSNSSHSLPSIACVQVDHLHLLHHPRFRLHSLPFSLIRQVSWRVQLQILLHSPTWIADSIRLAPSLVDRAFDNRPLDSSTPCIASCRSLYPRPSFWPLPPLVRSRLILLSRRSSSMAKAR